MTSGGRESVEVRILGGLVLLSALMKMDLEQPVQMKIGDAGLISNLGKTLFTNYVLPFEISSVLFLSAMIGAVVIGKKD